MAEDSETPDDASDAKPSLWQQIKDGRVFSLADAIGEAGGADLIKGASPVSKARQSELEVRQYLEQALVDSDGAMLRVLTRRVRADERSVHHDQPMSVLAAVCRRILSAEADLADFTRETDAEWGRLYQSRPMFDPPDQSPDPSDPYTIDGVRAKLEHLLHSIPSGD